MILPLTAHFTALKRRKPQPRAAAMKVPVRGEGNQLCAFLR